MKNLQRVVWSKGMFLTPQHFQAHEEYIENVLQFRGTASSSCNWGLIHLSVDQESLANGLFSLRHCSGILPDGLVFSLPDSDAAPASREIGESFPPTQTDLDVYLALPEQRPRGRNVTLSPNGAVETSTRYGAQPRPVVDETSGTEEKPVLVAAKNLRLVFGGESLDGTSFLRIGQIMRSPTGAFLLRPEFVPPCLSLEASDHLLLMLRRLIELLAAKASALAGARRQKGRTQADFGPGDVGPFWLLYTVNSYLPRLKHFWTQRRRHPEDLYVTMLGLAGALTTFALGDEARNLPDYDHDNLGISFSELDEKIRELLETAIPSKCISVALQLVKKNVWAGAIADEQHLKRSQFILSVGAQMGVEDVIKQVPKLVKISPPAEISRVIDYSLPAVKLAHTPVPPSAVPVKLQRQYFALNQSGTLWNGIVESKQVAIFTPDEIVNPELELLIVLE
jgi:type VI secretion system protein ImpJ